MDTSYAWSDDITLAPAGLTASLLVSQSARASVTISARIAGLDLGLDLAQELTIVGGRARYEATALRVSSRETSMSGSASATELKFVAGTLRIICEEESPSDYRRISVHVTGCFFVAFGPGPVRFDVDGLEWSFKLLKSFIEAKAELDETDNTAITAILECDLPPGVPSDVAMNALDDILWVVRFGTGRPCKPCRITLVAVRGDQIADAWTELRYGPGPVRGIPGPLPFDAPDLEGLGTYIAHTVPLLRARNTGYRIRAVMHMLVLAREHVPSELRLLVCANVLEILRHQFGVNVLVATGRAVMQGNDICWLAGAHARAKAGPARMSLAEILEALCQDLNLSGWDAGFVAMRNAIMHEGRVLGGTRMERHYRILDLLHFLDRVVLALLNVDAIGIRYVQCNARDPDRRNPVFAL